MTLSKVVSFLSNSTVTESKVGPAFRVREAAKEQVPLEQLVQQMRQMFTAPHERLCEARFDEMLDILDEQKSVTDIEVRALGQRITRLDDKVGEDYQLLSEVFRDALAKTRDELESKIDLTSQALRGSIADVDKGLRSSLDALSGSFNAHLAEDEVKRRDDRDQTLMTLEQRIAQWRAEIADSRRDDMEEVASSMMDIGKRLLALRKD